MAENYAARKDGAYKVVVWHLTCVLRRDRNLPSPIPYRPRLAHLRPQSILSNLMGILPLYSIKVLYPKRLEMQQERTRVLPAERWRGIVGRLNTVLIPA